MSKPDAETREPVDSPRAATTFVVRITLSRAGELAGNVQRVRTGERRAFHRAEAIGAVIAEMLGSDGDDASGDAPAVPGGGPATKHESAPPDTRASEV